MFVVMIISEDGQSIICEIYSKYYKRMLYKATELLGAARGEEAVHDIFVKIIEKYDNNMEFLGDKPGQYFVIMTKNHSINVLKGREIEIIPLDEDIMYDDIFQSPYPDPEDVLLEGEALERLASLIQRLTPSTRQILEYKFIEEYSNIEIADMLNLSQTAVSTRIDKAKKRLREIIESEAELDSGN